MSWLSSFTSAAFWGIFLLSILVFLHEGGHFLAARAFDMRVTEFFLGMPCRYKLSHKSRTRGTEIGVTPILLGGYNRICGMSGPAGARAAEVLSAVACAGRIKISQLSEDLAMDTNELTDVLSVLVDWASVEPYYDEDAGENPSQKTWPEQVQTVERDVNLLTAFDRGHDFSLPGSTKAGESHALPDGGADAFLAQERSRTYQGKGFFARVLTLVAGPAVNVVLGIALVVGCLSIGGVQVIEDVPEIGSVEVGSLAERCGLAEGDRISSVNGTSVSTWVELCDQLNECLASGQTFTVEFSRDGQQLEGAVDPTNNPLESGMFGITGVVTTLHPSVADSIKAALNYVTATVSYIAQLFQPAHTAEVVSQSSSVVGISVMASQAAASGARDFLFLMAAISLSLGFMNLIPIPPLDGGKFLIEVIQLLIRRDVSMRVQNALSYLGIVLAMILFFFVLKQDIVRIAFGG